MVEDEENKSLGVTGTTGATGGTEEDSNSTPGEDGARNNEDNGTVEEWEIVVEEGENTEAAVASDEGEDMGATGAADKSTGDKNPPREWW